MPILPVPYVLQIVGYKNSGKTTLVASLVRHMKTNGYAVGTVKHDAHDFTMDTPGTDTWKHQEAGADWTAISSSRRTAILANRPEPLPSLLAHMGEADLIFVEGFRQEHYPKLVLLRGDHDLPLLSSLTHIAAVLLTPEAEGLRPSLASQYTVISRNDFPAILHCVERLVRQAKSVPPTPS